jgi:hypothetical protein
MGQRLSGQAALCFRLIHNGRKITIESDKFNSTKQNETRKYEQLKTQSETRESNSTKHKVKHVNPTAQNTKCNT